MTVRPLLRPELQVAAHTLALAFDADPLFLDLLPAPAARQKWLDWFFLRALKESFAVGGAFTLEGGPEVAVMGLYPSGTWPSWLGEIRATSLPPGIPTWRFVRSGLHVERRIHELHPEGPHLYLYVLGVHPSQKGRGLGGALLRHAMASARAAGVVSHLETSNPDNLSLYRRFGFETREEITSHGGPPIWTMTTT
jgi:ribosomal protein S18 acetylase RimI-like enzyme